MIFLTNVRVLQAMSELVGCFDSRIPWSKAKDHDYTGNRLFNNRKINELFISSYRIISFILIINAVIIAILIYAFKKIKIH